MGDLVLNLISSPDGKVVISVNSGYLPHAIAEYRLRRQAAQLGFQVIPAENG